MPTPAQKRFAARRKRKAASNAGKKALAKVNKLERSIELKRLDINGSAPVNTTASTSILRYDLISTGDASNQRTGSKIKPKSWKFAYEVEYNNGAGSPQAVRIILLQTKNVRAGTVITALSDLFDTTTVNSTQHPYTWEKSRQFRILYDKHHVVGDTGSHPAEIYKTIKIPGNKLHNIRFTPGGTTIEYGGLQMVAISNFVATLPSVRYTSRLVYTDL